MNTAPLYLKNRQERRLRSGHPWVFSNEVDIGRSPLTGFEPGAPVEIRTHRERFVANAYVNPHSLICARVVSRRPDEHLDEALIERRIRMALALRERLFEGAFYRLVFGESDGLPGLVVDRYGDTLVAQIGTAGMERRKAEVVTALEAVLAPRAIVLRNDTPSRALEGLDTYTDVPRGTAPEWITLEENGARFEVSPLQGQKTGWYYDQRMNRRHLLDWVRDRRVLDLFSYRGAWGVQAAAAGAREVVCVDSSAPAIEGVRRNAGLNGVEAIVTAECADVFGVLRAYRAEQRRFDVVVLDPPAFVRRKKDLASGLEAYRRVNGLGMQLLGEDGLLVSASCSFRLTPDLLLATVGRVAHGIGRRAAVFRQGHQAPDHPVHPALPESSYLKALFTRVVDD